MKILKTLFIIILAFIVLWIVVALFSPKTMETEQHIVIDRSPALVFNQVNDLTQWKNWSPWEKRDPDMKIVFSEKKQGEGAFMEWQSKKDGNGKETIIESRRPEAIKIAIIFEDWEESSIVNWYFEKEGEKSTKVTWDILSPEIPFFIRPMIFLYNKSLEKDYIEGLNNLKEMCEKLPETGNELNVKIEETVERPYIGKKLNVRMKDIGPAMRKAYGEIMSYIGQHQLTIAGPAFSINISNQGDFYEFIAAMTLDKDPGAAPGFESGIIPPTQAARILHFGNYSNLPASYHIIETWIEDNAYTISGPSWEEYITDPGSEPDTTKWETRIYFPVR